MQVMIVDDEQPSIDELVFLFSKYTDVAVNGTYTNPVKALEAARALKSDTAFIDVSMPHMSGFELADNLKSINSNIQLVFVTAHSRLLEDIKKVRPVLFILKPVSEARLDAIIGLLRSRFKS